MDVGLCSEPLFRIKEQAISHLRSFSLFLSSLFRRKPYHVQCFLAHSSTGHKSLDFGLLFFATIRCFFRCRHRLSLSSRPYHVRCRLRLHTNESIGCPRFHTNIGYTQLRSLVITNRHPSTEGSHNWGSTLTLNSTCSGLGNTKYSTGPRYI